MNDMAKTMITDHNEMLRTDRLDPNRFTKTKGGFGAFGHNQTGNAYTLSQMRKSKMKTQHHEAINEVEEDPMPEVNPLFWNI